MEPLVTDTIIDYNVDVGFADPERWVCVIRHVGRSR
jgi:hypothetical protein